MVRSWVSVFLLILIIWLLETIAFCGMRALEETKERLASDEIKLKTMVDELRRETRVKTEFLANVSHEVRTPLNGIMGFAQVMREHLYGPLNEEQAWCINYIINSSNHLLEVLNDILDFSKADAGRIELYYTRFSIRELIDEAFLLFRVRARKHRINFSVKVPENIELITADRKRIKQVLFNLISNAVKFTSDGGSITVSCRQTSPYELKQNTRGHQENGSFLPSADSLLPIDTQNTPDVKTIPGWK